MTPNKLHTIDALALSKRDVQHMVYKCSENDIYTVSACVCVLCSLMMSQLLCMQTNVIRDIFSDY